MTFQYVFQTSSTKERNENLKLSSPERMKKRSANTLQVEADPTYENAIVYTTANFSKSKSAQTKIHFYHIRKKNLFLYFTGSHYL